jgi:hypothetical protein
MSDDIGDNQLVSTTIEAARPPDEGPCRTIPLSLELLGTFVVQFLGTSIQAGLD